MDAFARWLTRHPLAVVVANLAVTAVLGLYALHIRIENWLESMLPASDPKVGYCNPTRPPFRGAAITAFFKSLTDAQYLDLGVDRRIMEILAAEAGPEALVYTGAAHVKQAAVDLMRRDIARFTPIALALMLLVLWLSFGTLR